MCNLQLPTCQEQLFAHASYPTPLHGFCLRSSLLIHFSLVRQ